VKNFIPGNSYKMNMVKVNTRRFGEIEVAKDKIITIKSGILGFPEATKFTFIEKERDDPFKWFQSVQFSDLAFVILDPFIFFPDYKVEIPDDVAKELELESIAQAIALVIVVIPKNLIDITANLLAPVIINPYKRIARQTILVNSQYSTKHYLIPRNNNEKPEDEVK
jgi:flagellar assembly factor FliW